MSTLTQLDNSTSSITTADCIHGEMPLCSVVQDSDVSSFSATNDANALLLESPVHIPAIEDTPSETAYQPISDSPVDPDCDPMSSPQCDKSNVVDSVQHSGVTVDRMDRLLALIQTVSETIKSMNATDVT